MQHLHLVGFTAELDGLIFSTRRGSKSGGYVVSLDDRLLDSIREAVRLQTGAELDLEPEEGSPAPVAIAAVPELRRLGRVHSALSPKDIQARLRAGRSVAEVADEAEVDESWILRFASPVLAEQSRIVERALQLPCRANRKGESAEPLDVSVTENLVERGTLLTPDEISSAWSAYHVRDSAWVVRFRYVSRRRQQVAQWAFDVADSTLVPINRLATELGYVEPGRRKRRVGPADVVDDRRQAGSDDGAAANAPASARSATKRSATKRSAVNRRAAGAKARVGKAAGTRRPAKAAAARRPAVRAGTARATTGAAKRAAPGTGKRAAKRAATPARNVTKATRAPAAKRPGAKPAKAPAVRRTAGSRAPAGKVVVSAAKRVAAKRATAGKVVVSAAKRVAAKRAPAGKVVVSAAKRVAAKRAPAGKVVVSAAKPAAAKRAPAGKVVVSAAKPVAAKRAPAGKVVLSAAKPVAAKRAPAKQAPAPKATGRVAPTAAKRAPARKPAAPMASVTAPRTPPPTALLVSERPPEPEVTAVASGPVPNGPVASGPVPNGAGPETVGPAIGGPVTAPFAGTDGAVRTRRSSVADLGGDPTVADGRRQRPLVAVRAAQPPVPLSERVVRLPSAETPGTDGTPETTGSVVIQAVPAGEGMVPPTLEP